MSQAYGQIARSVTVAAPALALSGKVRR